MSNEQSEVRVVESEGNVSLEITERPEVKVDEVTESSLLEQGLDPREVELAKKNNIIPEPKKEEKKTETKKESESKVEPEKKDEIKKEANKELSDEEEHELLNQYSKNEKGLYWQAKNERKKRQNAELERDFLKTKVKAFESQQSNNVSRETIDDKEPEIEDPLANLKDDDVITVSDIKKYEAKKAELEAKRLEKDNAKKAEERKKLVDIDNKFVELESGARERYDDFDDVMKLSTEILADPRKVFGDNKRMINKAIALGKAIYAEFGDINNVNPEFNATDLSYELGQLHPKYKSKSEQSNDGESMSESKMNKIVENSNKRISSASLAGGKRMKGADEISLDDVSRMSQADYNKLPANVRERLLKQAG